MAAWEEAKPELENLEATILVASVDSLEHTQEVVDRGLTYPVAYRVSKEEADSFGAWWSEDRGGYIQTAEFLLGWRGVVLAAMYASGPVGPVGADEAIRQITDREAAAGKRRQRLTR